MQGTSAMTSCTVETLYTNFTFRISCWLITSQFQILKISAVSLFNNLIASECKDKCGISCYESHSLRLFRSPHDDSTSVKQQTITWSIKYQTLCTILLHFMILALLSERKVGFLTYVANTEFSLFCFTMYDRLSQKIPQTDLVLNSDRFSVFLR